MKQAISVAVIVAMLSSTVAAQGPVVEQEKITSPTLALVGVFTAVVGVITMSPWGDEYHITGDTYCVSYDYRTVENGGCGQERTTVIVGASLLGAGVLMAWAGLRKKHVQVAPAVQFNKEQKAVGVSGKLQW